jgi:VWFA-related protein
MSTRSVVTYILLAVFSGQGQVTFRSTVDAVRLDVSVTRSGRPVRGLTARDFVLTHDGAVQRIESVEVEQLPVSVTLLLDTSYSLAGDKLARLLEATRTLIESLRAGDQAAVMTFSHQITLRSGFSADRARLMLMTRGLPAEGGTALRDGLFAALQLRPKEDTPRLLLVFSDGSDTASWLTDDEIVDVVKRVRTTVHTVSILKEAEQPAHSPGMREALGEPLPWPEPSRGLLDRVADVSGGRTFIAQSFNELQSVFGRALDEMRSRYLLLFYPTEAKRAGWHEVKVTVSGRNAAARSRDGYLVPSGGGDR